MLGSNGLRRVTTLVLTPWYFGQISRRAAAPPKPLRLNELLPSYVSGATLGIFPEP